jgi:hypothetical protein
LQNWIRLSCDSKSIWAYVTLDFKSIIQFNDLPCKRKPQIDHIGSIESMCHIISSIFCSHFFVFVSHLYILSVSDWEEVQKMSLATPRTESSNDPQAIFSHAHAYNDNNKSVQK